jgi:hypothetical protein
LRPTTGDLAVPNHTGDRRIVKGDGIGKRIENPQELSRLDKDVAVDVDRAPGAFCASGQCQRTAECMGETGRGKTRINGENLVDQIAHEVGKGGNVSSAA